MYIIRTRKHPRSFSFCFAFVLDPLLISSVAPFFFFLPWHANGPGLQGSGTCLSLLSSRAGATCWRCCSRRERCVPVQPNQHQCSVIPVRVQCVAVASKGPRAVLHVGERGGCQYHYMARFQLQRGIIPVPTHFV